MIRWMDEAGISALPTAAYGWVLAMAASAYSLLQRAIIAVNGRTSRLATALGRDLKGKISLVVYIVSVPIAFFNPWISVALYVA